MASKRPSAIENLPSASSSSGSEETSDSESSSHLPKQTTQKPQVQKPESEQQQDDEEEDDVSDNYSVNATTPVSNALTIVPPVNQHQECEKKGKENEEGEQPKKKAPPIVRIWNEEGELAVLRAIDEYKSKRGVDPSTDTELFFKFAKNLVPIDVNKNQLMDKIRKLKKKFQNNVAKGEGLTFTKANRKKVFDLSKMIWGAAESNVKKGKRKSSAVEDSVDEESESCDKRNKKAKKEITEDDRKLVVVETGGVSGECLEGDRFWDKYPRLKKAIEMENNEAFLLDFSKIGDAKAKELENKWSRYQKKAAKLKLFKLELVTEQTKVLLEELTKM